MIATAVRAFLLVLFAASLAGAEAPDPWITARVKIALATSGELGGLGLGLHVDTVDGKVTIHGQVGSEEERAAAEKIARSVKEVREVRNLLQLVPASRREKTEATDHWIARRAAETLAKGEAGEIAVASVHDGVVLLTGEARSSAEVLRAVDSVRRVRGVRKVASEVRTASDDAALDVWNGRELSQEGESLADVAADVWMTAQVRLALFAEDEVSTADLSVDTHDGVVTLFGTVASEEEKGEAEDDAEDVDGVREVRNLLQVVPPSEHEEVARTDGELEDLVTKAIYARPEMRGTAVGVAVRDGFVRLEGRVPSLRHRVNAAAAARGVRGVRAVDSEDVHVATTTKPRREDDEDDDDDDDD